MKRENSISCVFDNFVPCSPGVKPEEGDARTCTLRPATRARLSEHLAYIIAKHRSVGGAGEHTSSRMRSHRNQR